MDLNKDLIEIGTIVNTFGKNGTVKLMMHEGFEFNDEIAFEDKFLFYLSKAQVIEPLRIKKLTQTQRNLLLIDFFGIDNINTAEKLKAKAIYSLREDNLFIEAIDYKTYHIITDLSEKPLMILDEMENAKYLLVSVEYQGRKIWIPLIEEYVQAIDDSQNLIVVKNFERLVN